MLSAEPATAMTSTGRTGSSAGPGGSTGATTSTFSSKRALARSRTSIGPGVAFGEGRNGHRLGKEAGGGHFEDPRGRELEAEAAAVVRHGDAAARLDPRPGHGNPTVSVEHATFDRDRRKDVLGPDGQGRGLE